MTKATLIINGEKEFALDADGVTSIGRAPDNTIPLAEDANISRYHIEIETRGDEFRLVELGSSNGTTVNGTPLTTEILLRDGDQIVLGNSSEIQFKLTKQSAETEKIAADLPSPEIPAAEIPAAENPLPSPDISAAENAGNSSKLPLLLGVTAVVCGLAVVAVVAAALLSFDWTTKCEAKAVITKPENGDTIKDATEVEADVQDAKGCVKRAVFLLDGSQIASADSAPYSAPLDPKQFPELADGGSHSLKVVLEDEKGNIISPSEVLLAFETLETATPLPTPNEEETPAPTPKQNGAKTSSLIEVQEMCKRLVKEFSGSANYKFSEQFLQEVQKKTGDYAAEGYFARATEFRDLINVEFHKEHNLAAPFGFVLAMSRSKFAAQKQGSDEGLWQISPDLAAPYKSACPDESLSDAKQICAAKASSIYAAALVNKIFGGDDVYAAAAFGMSEQEAESWKNSLPADRSDLWKTITAPKQREQLARFFAAGIVMENPQKFGLKKDKPISDLYRNLLGN